MARVLVVEDEAHIAEGIRQNLDDEGHEVSVASDGEQALEAWARSTFDLIIMDVMMPALDGFSVCEKIRRCGDCTPILFLTAKAEADDRIAGLELGGDDYLAKPFQLKELILRVSGLVRRNRAAANDDAELQLSVGPCRVNLRTLEVARPDGHVAAISKKEADILKLLVEHHDEVVSCEEILDKVWASEVYPATRAIDQLVHHLAENLKVNKNAPNVLQTVQGVGYRYVPVMNDKGA